MAAVVLDKSCGSIVVFCKTNVKKGSNDIISDPNLNIIFYECMQESKNHVDYDVNENWKIIQSETICVGLEFGRFIVVFCVVLFSF